MSPKELNYNHKNKIKKLGLRDAGLRWDNTAALLAPPEHISPLYLSIMHRAAALLRN